MKNKKSEYLLKKTNKIIFFLFFVFSFFTVPGQNLYFIQQHCYGTENDDIIQCVAHAENNGYYLGIVITEYDSTFPDYHGGKDIAVIKTDSSGNIVWQKCYGGSNDETITKIININDTSYYLIGHTTSYDGDVSDNSTDTNNTWIVKINNSGTILWEKCIGGEGAEIEKEGILTSENGLLVLDNITSGGGNIGKYYGEQDIWLCKLDNTGTIVWETTLGNMYDDGGDDIIKSSNNTYVMIGYSSDSGGMITCRRDTMRHYTDVWLVELDTAGHIIKQNCYGGGFNDAGKSIVEYETGYVFVAYTDSKDMDVSGLHGHKDYWVVKVSDEGTLIWQKCVGGDNDDLPVAIFKRAHRGYMVFGITYSKNSGDVSGFHGNYGTTDIFVAKLNNDGYLLDKMCIGSNKTDFLESGNQVIQKDKYYYAMLAGAIDASGDVECSIDSPIWWIHNTYGWFLSLKDCSGFVPPEAPDTIKGPEVFCLNKDSVSNYYINPLNDVWGYDWLISPPGAATYDTVDSSFITVKWHNDFEGTGVVFVRSYDDCHYSQWSPMKTTEVTTCSGFNKSNYNVTGILIYPNPAANYLTVELPAKPEQKTYFHVYDIFGKSIAKLQLKSVKTIWNTTEIKNGIYFYTLQTDILLNTGKFIIKK